MNTIRQIMSSAWNVLKSFAAAKEPSSIETESGHVDPTPSESVRESTNSASKGVSFSLIKQTAFVVAVLFSIWHTIDFLKLYLLEVLK